MRKLIFILCCLFINGLYAQSNEELCRLLDSVEHSSHVRFYNYSQSRVLPDSIKKKMVNVLNGYLPPQVYKRAYTFSRGELQYITENAKRKCKYDTECIKKTKDSLKIQSAKNHIEYVKKKMFTSGFILALAGWDVHEAKHILWENRNNNKTFPLIETYMALAKFGYSEALDSLLKWVRVDVKCNEALMYPNEYIDKKIDELEDVASYIRCKEFYYRILDLFDVDAFGYSYEHLSGDDEIYMSEYNVLSILSKRVLLYNIETNNSDARIKLSEIYDKWIQMMPFISDKGYDFIVKLCDRKIIIDVDMTTIETIEQLCCDDVSNIHEDHLINILNQHCSKEIKEEDIRNYIRIKRFRNSGLKSQMKTELRDWIDRYVVFD